MFILTQKLFFKVFILIFTLIIKQLYFLRKNFITFIKENQNLNTNEKKMLVKFRTKAKNKILHKL